MPPETIIQFGLPAAEQKFYDRSIGRNTANAADPGTTVFKYFTQDLSPAIPIDKHTICVNVGRKTLSLKDGHN
jgi:hypothetical protein